MTALYCLEIVGVHNNFAVQLYVFVSVCEHRFLLKEVLSWLCNCNQMGLVFLHVVVLSFL